MNQKRLLILEHCKEDYVSLNPLASEMPRSTLYVYVKDLVRDGYLSKRGTKYKTIQKGLAKLTEERVLESQTPDNEGQTTSNRDGARRLAAAGLGAQVRRIILENKENRLDYDSNLARLKDKLERIGVGVPGVEGFVQTHEVLYSHGLTSGVAIAILKEMKRQNLSLKEAVMRMEDSLRRYGSLQTGISSMVKESKGLQQSIDTMTERVSQLEAEISGLGYSPDQIRRLVGMDSLIREAGIDTPDIERFVVIHRNLRDLGFDLGAVEVLMVELNKTNMSIEKAIEKVIGYARSFGGLEKAREKFERAVNVRRRQLEQLQGEFTALMESKSNLTKEVNDLVSRKDTLESVVARVAKEAWAQTERCVNIKQDVALVLGVENEATQVVRRIKDLHSEEAALEKEIAETKKSLEEVQRMHSELNDDILACKGWRAYLLSGKAPTYEMGFWTDIEHLLGIRKGKEPILKLVEPQINERVCKRMIGLYQKFVNENVVPKAQYEKMTECAESFEKYLKDAEENERKLRKENERLSRELAAVIAKKSRRTTKRK